MASVVSLAYHVMYGGSLGLGRDVDLTSPYRPAVSDSDIISKYLTSHDKTSLNGIESMYDDFNSVSLVFDDIFAVFSNASLLNSISHHPTRMFEKFERSWLLSDLRDQQGVNVTIEALYSDSLGLNQLPLTRIDIRNMSRFVVIHLYKIFVTVSRVR